MSRKGEAGMLEQDDLLGESVNRNPSRAVKTEEVQDVKGEQLGIVEPPSEEIPS